MTLLPYSEHFSILYIIEENYRNIPLLSRSPLTQHHCQQVLFIGKKKKKKKKPLVQNTVTFQGEMF